MLINYRSTWENTCYQFFSSKWKKEKRNFLLRISNRFELRKTFVMKNNSIEEKFLYWTRLTPRSPSFHRKDENLHFPTFQRSIRSSKLLTTFCRHCFCSEAFLKTNSSTNLNNEENFLQFIENSVAVRIFLSRDLDKRIKRFEREIWRQSSRLISNLIDVPSGDKVKLFSDLFIEKCDDNFWLFLLSILSFDKWRSNDIRCHSSITQELFSTIFFSSSSFFSFSSKISPKNNF